MRTILTNNSVRYALFLPTEHLIIDICRDSDKMNIPVTRPFNARLMRVIPYSIYTKHRRVIGSLLKLYEFVCHETVYFLPFVLR